MILYIFSSRTTTKIGISANVQERIAYVQRYDRTAKLFFCCRLGGDAKNYERNLHEKYKRRRRPRKDQSGKTEWFAVHPLRPAFWLLYWRIGQLLKKTLYILAIIILTILATLCFFTGQLAS